MRLILAVGLLCATARAGDDPFALGNFTTTDAQCSPILLDGQAGFRISTGTNQPWPGVVWPAPHGSWNWASHGELLLTVTNIDTKPVEVYCRVDNAGADGENHCVTGSVLVEPSATARLHVNLTRASNDPLDGKLFAMRGYPAAYGGPATVDPSNITQILIFVSKPAQPHLFEVGGFCAAGNYTPPIAWSSDAKPFFPFIDTFGQYRHKDWPGKTKSLAGLVARRDAESRELSAAPGPAGWDKFGGAASGPQLPATGFFRVEKYHSKWWLVDPAGHLFFSNGIDCVGQDEITPIAERANWFADFPAQPEFAQFLSQPRALLGHYAGTSPESFSFSDANLFRKYGPDWRAQQARLIPRRLRSWGINTIGNWSSQEITAVRLTPYTDSIGSWGAKEIEGSDGYWGKFPDVFDPSFSNNLRLFAQARQNHSANDPWCLGYFSDNEMSWGDNTSIAVAALKSPAGQSAKKAFLQDLQAKYGEIKSLNEAWGTHYVSWDEWLQARAAPDPIKAGDDLRAFYTRAAEQYFRVARDAVKSIAPKQLYLGCRFAWVNELAAAAAAKYCDVVSYNIYQRNVAGFKFNGGADVPLLIGEFHFGALDRGLFHTGLVPTENQQARADAYQEYVLGALHHPQFVGCHWFQYRDEPVTGRSWDEENYQIGFVDVADSPYRELVQASRRVGDHLYDAVTVN